MLVGDRDEVFLVLVTSCLRLAPQFASASYFSPVQLICSFPKLVFLNVRLCAIHEKQLRHSNSESVHVLFLSLPRRKAEEPYRLTLAVLPKLANRVKAV